MAIKMTKSDVKRLTAYGDDLAKLRARIIEDVAQYNKTLEDVGEYVIEITEEMQNRFNEASERWQESDKAIEAQDWIRQLEEMVLTELDIDIDEDDENVIAIRDLPHEPQT